MLSFNSRRTSRLLAVTSIVGTGLMLGACGFKPMYSASADSASTTAYLRAVQIDHIDERIGQMMRTALKRRFHPTRTNTAYHYSLNVSVSEGVSTLAVEKDASTTRANLQLTTQYTLVRIADQLTLQSGNVRGVSSYNLLTSNFATEAAKKDARKRAIDTVADQLKTKISAYFNGPGRQQPPLGYKQDIR